MEAYLLFRSVVVFGLLVRHCWNNGTVYQFPNWTSGLKAAGLVLVLGEGAVVATAL